MSEELGAVGDIASGALIARTVEPAAGGGATGSDGHTHEGACLNCGTALLGPHCHACGQRAHVHRTLGAFAHDLLHGVLHFEGKTWRTLPLLVWRPGKLTREYIDGKRASYVSPIALFLFVVFLSFAAFNLLGSSTPINTGQAVASARAAQAENARQLNQLREERGTVPADAGARRAAIDARIKDLEGEQKGLAVLTGGEGQAVSAEIWEGFSHESGGGDTAIDRMVQHVRENPQLAIYKAQSNAYKYSWMLIPLSVPFVWLLFAFSRRFGAYDHTVFATYSITFMIALVAIVSLLVYLNIEAGMFLLLFAPLHMYRQLRGAYGLGRLGAAWRMLALSAASWIVIALFAAIIAMLVG